MGVFASLSTALARAFSRRSASSALALAPAESARLGIDGPTTGAIMHRPQPRRTLVRTLAIDADIDQAISIFNRADYGQTWDLQDLIEDSRDRDSRLDSVSRTRMFAVQSRPWVVTPPEGWENNRTAKIYAENVAMIFREMRGFRGQIVHLAHGALNGYAVCEQDWFRDHRGWSVPELQDRHVNRFGFNHNLDIGFLPWDRSGLSFLVPLNQYPDRFVVHSPLAGRSSYPWRRGALRTRILPSLCKRGGARMWLTLLERWGQPQVYVTVGDGESENVLTLIDEALQSLSDEWQARFPQGVEPKTIDKSGTVSSDLHSKYIEMANTEDAIAVLGQNLTTEVQGGSFAATEAHRAVADTILAADLEELGETITQQTVEPICRYNHWTDAPPPVFRLLATRQLAWTVDDVREGICTEDEYRALKGSPAKPDGAGSRYRTPPEGPTPAVSITTAPNIGPTGAGSPAEKTVQDTAFNGAQTTALLEIGRLLKSGEITADYAVFAITKSFPTITEDEAREGLATTTVAPEPPDGGTPPADGSPPAAPPAGGPAAPPGGADAASPFGPTSSTTAPSETSARSKHPLASALSSPSDA